MRKLTEQDKTEYRIQQEIVMWYRNNFCLKHHNPRSIILSIPNNKNQLQKEIGMMSGASDLMIIHNSHPHVSDGNWTFFVEVKTPTGYQSVNQVKFQAHIEQMGTEYYIVRSLEEFQTIING